MRLICGLIRLDGADADPALVRAMAAAMTAPGLFPRLALRADGPAALAVLDFRRPAGDAPFDLATAADGSWIAADARLDEDVDLADAVLRHGLDLPDHLLGDFALAAWNPDRRELVCARDFVGVRPLAWTHQAGRLFAFASLPKGLVGAGIATGMPDLVAMGRLLAETYDTGERTNFCDVFRLRAGCALQVTPRGVREHRAFDPDPGQVGLRRISHADAAAELRRLVEQAVACRLPAAGPVATQLSGGLDSSAVAVIAARTLRPQGRRLHAMSLLPRDWQTTQDKGEQPYIAAVLAQEPDIAWTWFHSMPADDPDFGDPDLLPLPLYLGFVEQSAAAAAQAGADLLLSGAGGDEGPTYNGSDIHAALLRQGRWRPLPSALRALARRDGLSLPNVLVDRLVRPLLPDWAVAVRRRFNGQHLPLRFRQLRVLELLQPELRARVAATLSPDPAWRNRPRDRVEMFVKSYVIGRNDYWSTIAARHGVAFSAPLLDRRIVDFILSLPLERFLADGFARQPYRTAMTGILPEKIRTRTGKSAPTPDAMLNFARVKPGLLAQVEALRGSAAEALVDLDAVAGIIAAAPDQGEASMLVRRNAPAPAHWKRAFPALVALSVGRQIVGWSKGGSGRAPGPVRT